MEVLRDSVESEGFEGRTLQNGCCGMSKTEKERLSEENSGREQYHGGRGGNVSKSGSNQQLLHTKEREEKGTGRKIHQVWWIKRSLIRVKKIVSGQWWKQKLDSWKGSQTNIGQGSQVSERYPFMQNNRLWNEVEKNSILYSISIFAFKREIGFWVFKMRKFEHLLKHKGNHIHTKEDCRIRRGAFISTQYPRRRDGVNDSISKNNGVGGWDGGGKQRSICRQ